MTSAPRLVLESWDPDYGSPLAQVELEPSDATIDASVERPPRDWAPVPSSRREPAGSVRFVDGVRRIEAVVWTTTPHPRRGLCASCAAGSVLAGSHAEVEAVGVRRLLLTAADVTDLPTVAGPFVRRTPPGEELDQLSLGLQQQLAELEIEIAERVSPPAELTIVDGPLSGRQGVPGAVGYVKTHRVSYLPDDLTRIVLALRPGDRTPLFLITSSWTRYSWYLRLPGAAPHPWAGIVRLEAAGALAPSEAVALAERTVATLPRYASQPHKEPRAPQNLVPIAGLERVLRARLGDAGFVQRALRAAAGSPVEVPGPAAR